MINEGIPVHLTAARILEDETADSLQNKISNYLSGQPGEEIVHDIKYQHSLSDGKQIFSALILRRLPYVW